MCVIPDKEGIRQLFDWKMWTYYTIFGWKSQQDWSWRWYEPVMVLPCHPSTPGTTASQDQKMHVHLEIYFLLVHTKKSDSNYLEGGSGIIYNGEQLTWNAVLKQAILKVTYFLQEAINISRNICKVTWVLL